MAWTRDEMAARAAKELQDGFYVNLGIGIPTLVANYIPEGMHVTLQSENGMLGMGPFPFEGEEDARSDQRRQADDHRAGLQLVFLVGRQLRDDPRRPHRSVDPGRHAGGGERRPRQLDWCPARWSRAWAGPWTWWPASSAWWWSWTIARSRAAPKLLKQCTLPLTGAGVVDLLITELGVFEINRGKTPVKLIELAPGVTVDEVRAKTEAAFEVAV